MRITDCLLLTSFGKGAGIYLVRATNRLLVDQLSSVPTTGIGYANGVLAIAVRNEVENSSVGVINVWVRGRSKSRILIRNCPDIHDVKIHNDCLMVVSSLTNSVISIDLPSGKEVARKVFEGSPDSWHLNDLVHIGDEWFVSGFGDPSKKSWREDPLEAGLVRSLERNNVISGFTNPHSPRFRNGKLYICNSGQNEVLQCDLDGSIERRKKLGNFTRGLYLGIHHLLVGESSHRARGGASGVALVNLETFDVIKTAQIDAAEIYGIERVPRWATRVVSTVEPSPF